MIFKDIRSIFQGGEKDIQNVRGTWVTLGDSEMVTENELIRRQYGLIYPTISSIAEDFAKIKLKLMIGDEEAGKLAPAWLSLQLVNDDWSTYDLYMAYAAYMLLLGEAIWHVPRKGNTKFREIYPLNILNVQDRKYSDTGQLVEFKYKLTETKFITYRNGEDIEFIHDKSLNVYDLRLGYKKIGNVKSVVEASESAIDYNRRFFMNDATPNLVIWFKNKVSEGVKTALKASWLANFRGKDKSHKTAVLGNAGEMNIERLAMSNKDMEFSELLKKADERVLANWRMNKVILGQTEGVNRATVEGAEYIHSKRVIDPMYMKFISFLNEKYLPLFYNREEILVKEIRFVYQSPISKDIALLSSVASTGVAGKPFLTINEAREMVGKERIDNPDYDEIPSQPDYGIDQVRELERKIRALKEQNQELKEVVNTVDEIEKKRKELREVWRKEHIKRADRIEPMIVRDLNKYFKGLAKRLEIKGKKLKKGIKYTTNFNSEEEKELFKEALRSGLYQGSLEAWMSADSKVPGVIPYSDVESELNTILVSTIETNAQEVIPTTEEDIKQLLEEAVIQGWSVDDLAEKLQELVDTYTATRSLTIARTALNTVVSGVTAKRYEIARDDGLIEKMEWLAELDDKTRPAHSEADGQKVRVGGYFNVGGEKMKYPGDPSASPSNIVNCRCTIIPVL